MCIKIYSCLVTCTQAIASSDAKVVTFLIAEDATKIIPKTTVNQGTMVAHGICGSPDFLCHNR
jgi:hypothetical protein